MPSIPHQDIGFISISGQLGGRQGLGHGKERKEQDYGAKKGPVGTFRYSHGLVPDLLS